MITQRELYLAQKHLDLQTPADDEPATEYERDYDPDDEPGDGDKGAIVLVDGEIAAKAEV
jgi:hypothetical protein